MNWVWQLPEWPNYEYDAALTQEAEKKFLYRSGVLKGSIMHLHRDDTEIATIEILCQEAMHTSSIEGEILQRDSVQSSIRKHLGLQVAQKKFEPGAYGISEMMVDLYQNYSLPLTHQILYKWNKMLLHGRRDINQTGKYRTHAEPMQIISANLASPKLFYEAPPSKKMHKEMKQYINWFNENAVTPKIPLLCFVSIAHLYFEQIHPFEDGNGRIGRALAEKALFMRTGFASLISLSKIIEKKRKAYYQELQKSNHSLKVNNWILYFSDLLIAAQEHSISLVEFIIKKTKFIQRFGPLLNHRQEKAVLKIFHEGPEGFKGGFSAANYQAITKTSTATTTRDLADLITKGIMIKKGQLKGTRYFLVLS